MTESYRRPITFTPKEVGEILHCSERHVRDMVADGRIAAVRIGIRKLVISERALDEFLNGDGDQTGSAA